ncbi:SEC14-like protein 3 [Nephila pilipes]|uniref:SEC14-like protein 3 n=1 Tax=Nephila pilipes TaxID=299642 RepID=A0A8X6TLP5_NEPPI|nr:SEC14-like protein 3 [Nephila pilipes]
MTVQEEISSEEMSAIEELKRRTINDISPQMHEDETLYYRFLKARDFNLKNAEIMLRKHIAFRKEFQVDTIEDFKAPEVLLKYFPTSFIGYDKEGAPIRYISMAGDPKGILNSARKRDIIKHNIFTIEEDVRRTEEQTKKLGKPVTQIMYIYDFENVTFAKATNKKALEMMLLGINLFQDNYPERTKIILQINTTIYYSMMFSIFKSIIASAILSKINCLGTDNWKGTLLQLIDADVLPAFLGGNRTDPDGNPLCHSFIVPPRDVPDHYYMKKSEKTLSSLPGVKKLTITRFSKTELTFEVHEPNSFLEWEFETKNRDIAFGVYFRENTLNHSKPVEILPKQRIDTCYEPETGIYKCEKAGTYIVVFDNSYSWIHQKDIFYRMKIRGPNETESIEIQ